MRTIDLRVIILSSSVLPGDECFPHVCLVWGRGASCLLVVACHGTHTHIKGGRGGGGRPVLGQVSVNSDCTVCYEK